MSGLDFLKERAKFNAIREAISLLHKVMVNGYGLRHFDSVEQAEEVLYYLNSMLKYDGTDHNFYGACIVRDTDVNVFTYHQPISDEEEAKILERRKQEWNRKVQQEIARNRVWKRRNPKGQVQEKSKYPRLTLVRPKPSQESKSKE